MARTDDIVLGVWAVNPFQEVWQILGYLALRVSEQTSFRTGCGWLCAWQCVDTVAIHVILSSKLHELSSIISTHLVTDHVSLVCRSVVEIFHGTFAIPLLFLNGNQGQLAPCHCE